MQNNVASTTSTYYVKLRPMSINKLSIIVLKGEKIVKISLKTKLLKKIHLVSLTKNSRVFWGKKNLSIWGREGGWQNYPLKNLVS